MGSVSSCSGTYSPKIIVWCECLGVVVCFQSRLLPITRVLRQGAILTLGLLRTTSGTKALAVCRWLPADMEIRFALVWFILWQETFGRHDLLHTDYVLGLNQRISALDIARHEVAAFRTSGNRARLGWGHVDSLKFWVSLVGHCTSNAHQVFGARSCPSDDYSSSDEEGLCVGIHRWISS